MAWMYRSNSDHANRASRLPSRARTSCMAAMVSSKPVLSSWECSAAAGGRCSARVLLTFLITQRDAVDRHRPGQAFGLVQRDRSAGDHRPLLAEVRPEEALTSRS